MPRNALSIILLIVIVFAALRFLDSPPEQFQSKPDINDDTLVLVAYTDLIQTSQYDSKGQREHYFEATRVNHRQSLSEGNTDPGLAEMNKPNVTLFQNGVPKWHIQAQIGESGISDENIFLREGVVIEQLAEINSWKINTDSLWIEPNTQKANTDADVKLQTTGLISTGTGMKANFADETIEILADTETIYEMSK